MRLNTEYRMLGSDYELFTVLNWRLNSMAKLQGTLFGLSIACPTVRFNVKKAIFINQDIEITPSLDNPRGFISTQSAIEHVASIP